MKRSFVTTLALTVVFAALVAWYFIYEKKMKVQQTASEEKLKQVVSFKSDEIGEITLERPPKEATDGKSAAVAPQITKLKKTGSDWSLLEPVQDSADNGTISTMLSTLTSTKQERVVEEKPTDLTQYGLDKPKLKIEVKKDANSAPESVWIGRDTPVGSSTYAKTGASEAVYKISNSLRQSWDQEVKGLRSKNVWTINRADVSEIEVQNAKGSFILKKGDKDQWALARENLPADNSETNRTLNSLVDLKATDFVSEDGKDAANFGLGKPTARVFLAVAKDKPRLEIAFGKAKDKFYAKRSDRPIIYQVDKDTVEKMERPATAYRGTEIAIFNRFEVKRLKWEHGKETLELLKEDKGWTLPAEPTVLIDNAKVDAFLTKLQDTKISKYADGKKGGIANPELTLRAFEKADAGENERVVLSFGKKQGNLVPVSRKGLEIPFFIRDEDYKGLNPSRQDLLKVEKPAEIPSMEKKS